LLVIAAELVNARYTRAGCILLGEVDPRCTRILCCRSKN